MVGASAGHPLPPSTKAPVGQLGVPRRTLCQTPHALNSPRASHPAMSLWRLPGKNLRPVAHRGSRMARRLHLGMAVAVAWGTIDSLCCCLSRGRTLQKTWDGCRSESHGALDPNLPQNLQLATREDCIFGYEPLCQLKHHRKLPNV